MKRLLTLPIILVLLVGTAGAGGSLDSERVISLLKQNKVLWSYLGSTLEFSPDAWGVRCGNHWPEMGGARIAPYSLLAKQKGEQNYTLKVEVECEQHFFDKNGKEIPMRNGEITDEIMERAVTVKEKVISVRLTPYNDTD